MPEANDYPIPPKEAAAVEYMERYGHVWDEEKGRWVFPSGQTYN